MAHCEIDPDTAYEERRDREAGFFDWENEAYYPESVYDQLFDEAVEEENNEHMA